MLQPLQTFYRNHAGIINKLIAGFFYALIVLFFVQYIRTIDFDRLNSIRVHWGYLALALGAMLVARFCNAASWVSILRGLGAHNVHFSRQLLLVYAKAWLGRYIPGTAPWILGKIYFASRQGVSKQKLAISSVLEAALQVTVTLAVGLLMLLADTRLNVIQSDLKAVMIIVLVVCIGAILPPVFNRLMSLAYRAMRRGRLTSEHHATTSTLLRGSFWYGLVSVAIGVALLFVSKSVYPTLPYTNILFIIGVANLASVIGMLALFAPSGIGVREGVNLALLSTIMPTEYALAVTVAARLLETVADLAFFGIGKLLAGKPQGEPTGPAQ